MSERWSLEDIKFLEKNYNLPYNDLVSALHRSSRSLKHKVGQLGLHRDERKRYTEEEKRIAVLNCGKKSLLLPGRSQVAVARIRKEVLGTARPVFKQGWDIPSVDLAYFLGVVCSDMGIYRYNTVIWQKLSNIELINEVKRIFNTLFGLVPYERIQKVNGIDYNQVGVCSSQFLKNLGTKEAIEHGNLKYNNEWIDFLQEKFAWVFDDKFFWFFMGGLYDGDGSLVRRKGENGRINYGISLAIKPVRSRECVVSELWKRGFQFVPSSYDMNGQINDVVLRGGQSVIDKFLRDIECKITRKKVK
jgi:hypothetical protein